MFEKWSASQLLIECGGKYTLLENGWDRLDGGVKHFGGFRGGVTKRLSNSSEEYFVAYDKCFAQENAKRQIYI